MVHFFHVQKVVVFAVAKAFGKDTSHFAGLQAHAVAHKQDYVFGFLFSFGVGNGVVGNILFAVGNSFNLNVARFGKSNVGDAVNGYAVGSFNGAGFAKIFFGVNAIHGNFKIIGNAFNFNLQIKTLAF